MFSNEKHVFGMLFFLIKLSSYEKGVYQGRPILYGVRFSFLCNLAFKFQVQNSA